MGFAVSISYIRGWFYCITSLNGHPTGVIWSEHQPSLPDRGSPHCIYNLSTQEGVVISLVSGYSSDAADIIWMVSPPPHRLARTVSSTSAENRPWYQNSIHCCICAYISFEYWDLSWVGMMMDVNTSGISEFQYMIHKRLSSTIRRFKKRHPMRPSSTLDHLIGRFLMCYQRQCQAASFSTTYSMCVPLL